MASYVSHSWWRIEGNSWLSMLDIFVPAHQRCLLERKDNVSALLNSVLTTDALCAIGWWDEKSRYLSVCVSLRYTLVEIEPFSSRCSMTLRNGKHPSSLWLSKVNWIDGSMLLMCCNSDSMSRLATTQSTSSTYRFQHFTRLENVSSAREAHIMLA